MCHLVEALQIKQMQYDQVAWHVLILENQEQNYST